MSRLLPLLRASLLAVAASCAAGALVGCGDEPQPTSPPQISAPALTCYDVEGQDYPLVDEVQVTITDPDGDLLSSSVWGTVNGLVMELSDDDADQVYTWRPPREWDPPMVCRGEYTIIVSARDLEGQESEQTFEVSP